MLALLTGLLLSSSVTVTLPMEASVHGTEVELGEIARIDGAEPELLARLQALELGYAPAPGYSRLLVRERIAELVRRRLPEVEVRFEGERACRVRPSVQEIGEADLLAAARAELALRFSGSDATFTPRDRLPAVAVPEGRDGYRLRARVTATELSSGTVNVPVEILVDDVVYRTLWTVWEAEVWRTLPVLNREVRAGETLEPAMFERRRVQWSGGPAQAIPASSLAGSVAARDLTAGAVVTGHDVHRPTVVTAGNTVYVRVKKGPIEARTAGQALDSGAVGDRVRVRTQSGQDLYATVLSAELVQVDLGR